MLSERLDTQDAEEADTLNVIHKPSKAKRIPQVALEMGVRGVDWTQYEVSSIKELSSREKTDIKKILGFSGEVKFKVEPAGNLIAQARLWS